MASRLDDSLTVEELEAGLAAVERSAVLAPPRILRRVIKQDRQIGGIGLKAPHRKTYLIDAARLLQIVARDELDLAADAPLVGTIVLLPRPDADYLASLTAGEARIKYWRLLFHARVHLALDQKLADGALDAAAVRERIARIGPSAFEEIRTVLRQEDLLLPPVDDLAVYLEFAAVYLELRFFAASLVPRYFPSLGDTRRIDDLLAEEIDAVGLWAATRLPGAPNPGQPADDSESELPDETDDDFAAVQAHARPAEAVYRRLNRLADRAAGVGNAVRAAILRTRAARYVRPSLANRVSTAARDDLQRLGDRLQAALDLNDKESRRWSKALWALLGRSVNGFWTRESRILYDLQKVCVDHERDIYTLDLVEWALSRGRAPIKRHLPGQREVLMSKHLRVALRRAAKARIDERQRRLLILLLQAGLERAEGKLRERFRPLVAAALDEVGLRPANVPERVARNKLIEELLDEVIERDFLTMSDLRDAISRNNLKLPDLQSGRQFLSGDPLLQTDRKLSVLLDGVYHRGEVYLRLPQRLSSLAFGTPVGRLLVRYLAIPYGGAFVILEGVNHLALMIASGVRSGSVTAEASVSPGETAPKIQLVSPETMHLAIVVLGTFLLGLIYSGPFRRGCARALHGVFRGVRWLAVDLPRWLMGIAWVRRLLESPLYHLAARYVVKPLVFTALILAAFRALSRDLPAVLRNGVLVFFGVNVALNSRLGRNAEELVTDWAVRNWDRFRLRVLGAVVQMVMEFFNRVVDAIDRFLYSVDEWLRFRSGQGRLAIVTKTVLGTLWFFVTYFVRFCITLLIEPQINPVKHFPVVTVSHKVLLSLTPVLRPLTVGTLERFVSTAAAETIFWNVIFLVPGIVGFLVWELKENWRLYKANRPSELQPVPVGHHGETIVRLLRHGFHSGTVPKLYAKLRRADRKAHWTGNWKASRKHRAALRAVEQAVQRFVDRELLCLLAESQRFRPLDLRVGRVELGANSLRFDLVCPEIADAPLRMSLDEQAGWLVARIVEPGWTAQLADAPRQALADAVTGFYKMSGVELVHEQIEAALEPATRYDVNERGLCVWSDTGALVRCYDLRDDEPPPQPDVWRPVTRPEAFDREQLLFASWPVTWELWVEVWDRDQLGGRHTPRLVIGAHLLPDAWQRAVS